MKKVCRNVKCVNQKENDGQIRYQQTIKGVIEANKYYLHIVFFLTNQLKLGKALGAS